MKNNLVPLLILISLSLACTNTATLAQPVPTVGNPSPKLDGNVELIVIAEIGVQVRKACGVNNPTTGKILTNGKTVMSDGKEQELPDGSFWQPIEGGCVNSDYLRAVK